MLSMSKESLFREYTDCLCLPIHYKISILFWCLPFPKQSSLSLRLTFISWTQLQCSYLPMIGLVTYLWYNSPQFKKMPGVPKKGFYPGQCCFSSPWICHVWVWHLVLQHPSCSHEGSQPKIKSALNMVDEEDLEGLYPQRSCWFPH